MRSSNRLTAIATNMTITTISGNRPISVAAAVAPVKFSEPSSLNHEDVLIFALVMKTGVRFNTMMSMTRVNTNPTTLALTSATDGMFFHL